MTEKVTTEYVTVTRNDEVYECFPDMTRLPSGDLMVIYRESESHEGYEYCNLVVRRSQDEGVTWSERQAIVEGPRAKEGREYVKYNCPRICALSDGRVAAICDENVFDVPREPEGRRDIVIWWSEDDGRSWSEPVRTGIRPWLPDKIRELSDGTLLLGGQVVRDDTGLLTWHCCRSEDGGQSWSEPITIADDGQFHHCEGSILELPGGELVCYMRENSHQGYPGYKCISRDKGLTWEGPYRTLMAGCERPVGGMLESGKVLVTYRSNMRGAACGKQNQFASSCSTMTTTRGRIPATQAGRSFGMAASCASTTSSARRPWHSFAAGFSRRRTSRLGYPISDVRHPTNGKRRRADESAKMRSHTYFQARGGPGTSPAPSQPAKR